MDMAPTVRCLAVVRGDGDRDHHELSCPFERRGARLRQPQRHLITTAEARVAVLLLRRLGRYLASAMARSGRAAAASDLRPGRVLARGRRPCSLQRGGSQRQHRDVTNHHLHCWHEIGDDQPGLEWSSRRVANASRPGAHGACPGNPVSTFSTKPYRRIPPSSATALLTGFRGPMRWGDATADPRFRTNPPRIRGSPRTCTSRGHGPRRDVVHASDSSSLAASARSRMR